MSDTSGRTDRPILVVGTEPPAEFRPGGGGSTKTERPQRSRQGERLDERFAAIERMISALEPQPVSAGLPDADPELVLVFEVVDSISSSSEQLALAMQAAGLELLVEAEGTFEDEELGSDFARLSGHSTEPIPRFLHAAMASRAAVEQLLALWTHWKTGKRMIRGFGPFTGLFGQLNDVRPWGPSDRVRTTGLAEVIAASAEAGADVVPVSIELWFRADESRRRRAEEAVRSVIESSGGVVYRSATIQEVGFHGLAGAVPTNSLAAVVSNVSDVSILRSTEILYVRPGGQGVQVALPDDLDPAVTPEEAGTPLAEPIVAVLDGLPEANHELLRGRVSIFDPLDFGSDPLYTADRRRHGTMVASAVVWGDLGRGEAPLPRTVLCFPVMRPDPQHRSFAEAIPDNHLPEDLMRLAVEAIVGDGNVAGAAPSVKVFNVSLGDPLAQFDTIPSSWARVIDWLSHKHNVLFIVSAGNHPSLPAFPISMAELRALSGGDRNSVTMSVLAAESYRRRILSPAESLNAITVGALHSDGAGDDFEIGYRTDVWAGHGHPSPVSAHGRGIRRAVKPDVVASGGRQLFSEHLTGSGNLLPASGDRLPPGVKVAAPPDRIAYAAGTTFAAAEVTRRAARLVEVLPTLETPIEDRFLAVAAKAILVHGAVLPSMDYGVARDRLFGHGSVDRDYSSGCASGQATMLAVGEVGSRQFIDVALPLPGDLAALTEIRRISMTLAWLSPINWNHRQYRRAKLTVDGPREMPSATRRNVGTDYQLSRRGSVEHRVFETTRAFSDEQMTFKVACSPQAGGFDGTVQFALAVTLEVGANIKMDVYELVRQALQVRAAVRV